jgi:diguanylate cyclase (GGDEF)-like protein/PAS domain S-box-containing protein
MFKSISTALVSASAYAVIAMLWICGADGIPAPAANGASGACGWKAETLIAATALLLFALLCRRAGDGESRSGPAAERERRHCCEAERALRESEAGRKLSEERSRLAWEVFESSRECIMITDAEGTIVSVNRAFTAITGYTAEEVLGQNPRLLKSGHQSAEFYRDLWKTLLERGCWQGELWNRRKNGEVYAEWLSISTVYGADGGPTHFIGVASDITKTKRTEEYIRHLAYFDALTGLANRTLLREKLAEALANARRHGTEVSILFIDLDHFKTVNESLGHSLGDRLLKIVADRLRSLVKDTDTVARLGGDEFSLMLTETGQDAAAGVAQRIFGLFEHPITLDSHTLHVAVSIGISIYPKDGEDAESLLRYADAALYRAKESGRKVFHFFHPEMNEAARERLTLEVELRQAVARREFELHYQPQVELAGHRLVGLEALLRWHHPELGSVSPAKFIPIAENNGLIVEIGAWVLREACRQIKTWRDRGLVGVPVSVNVSAVQIRNGNLMQTLRDILEESGLPGTALELEVTESLMIQDTELILGQFRALKTLGVSVSIDDFGTGYSNLSYLKRFPIDKLKIDRSFVRDIVGNPDDAAIAHAVVSMGRSLRLKVIAEGVENEPQADILRKMGCDEGQGYLFARPMPAAKLEDWLRDKD